ncbi:hypothetical protein DSM104443_03944 [Usitatibacter rugosus]|uniref:Calx-beta domain-containing protein n=1 Tax=Usitatibacter rugosus TaxID=2732067 RepID=A0A6M4H027_9PROT|nr:Calx-beta domain-containing protein [Usitatibacter rugosus]QJR12850.1 hypothetical protein DSM104443_03944 [Usitatibacter rugosus]
MNRIAGVITTGLFMLCVPFAVNAVAPQMVSAAPATKAQRASSSLRSEAHPVKFNATSMKALKHLAEFEVTLPSGAANTFVLDLSQDHGGGISSFVGHHRDLGVNYRAVVTSGPGGTFAFISTPQGEFRIVPGGGQDWLVDVAQEEALQPKVQRLEENDARVPPAKSKGQRSPQGTPELVVPIPGVNTASIAKATPTPIAVIDLMFVYSHLLAAKLGPAVQERLNFIVTRINTAYADSEVAITLRLVGSLQVTYDGTDHNAALNAITPGFSSFQSDVFGSVEGLRSLYGADMVSLLIDIPGGDFVGSGVAWLGDSTPDPGLLYSVVAGCVRGCEDIHAHELGHNMGNNHDRATEQYDQRTASPIGTTTYSFGYAYCAAGGLSCDPSLPRTPPSAGSCTGYPECQFDNGKNFRDIMAYFFSTASGSRRLMRFSNPNQSNCFAPLPGPGNPPPNGLPQPCGSATANTAKVMNDNRAALSGVMPTVIGSVIEFATTSVVASPSGNATLTVTRKPPGTSAVSIGYTTQSGTATSVADFTPVSGTLSWIAGDLASKTITIPIAGNGVNEESEAFTVVLSNPLPTGASGAFLGPQSTARVLIPGTFPGGGMVPAGFVTPGASNGAWTVANNQSFMPGDTSSLVSAQLLGLSPPTYPYDNAATSDLTYTRKLLAGTIGFAYRISSYDSSSSGISKLTFSIDGTTVFTVPGGESGWKFVTIPLSAGFHTLRWRFSNAWNEPCNAVSFPNDPAQGGVNCEDRAWIDAVSLPVGSGLGMVVTEKQTHEAAGSVDVVVARTGDDDGPASVSFATSNGTAIAGTHYTATTGTLTWTAGDSAPQIITIPILDNGASNAARTFNVSLSAPTGATLIEPSTTVVTIADDENTVQFSAASSAWIESGGSTVIAVTRTGSATGPASVSWTTVDGSAISGTDFGVPGVFAPVTGTLTWAAGDASTQSVNVGILNNDTYQPARSFSVVLSNPTGAGATLGGITTNVVAIDDNETTITFGAPTYSVTEGGSTVLIPVNRLGGTQNQVSATWTTANGTAMAGADFGTSGNPAQRSGVLTWFVGDLTPKTIAVGISQTIPILDDTAFEGDETFTITLSNPTNFALLGPVTTTTITLVDNESRLEFSPSALTVGETGANGTLTVTRTGNLAGVAGVTYTTVAGTAAAASDFTQTTGTLNWTAGDGSPKSISVGPNVVAAPFVRVLNDAAVEADETFTVVLSAATGTATIGPSSTATVTIVSEDSGVSLSAATYAIAESGASLVVPVARSGSATGAISVNYATTNSTAISGTHFGASGNSAPISGTLSWPDGDATARSITIPIIDNSATNAARTFTIGLSGAVGTTVGTPASATVTISDDDNTLQFAATTATVTEGTPTLSLSVTRSGGAGAPASVSWSTVNGTATAGTDFGVAGVATPTTGMLSWVAGDAVAKTVTIPILDDAIVENPKAFTVTLSSPVGAGTSLGVTPSVAVTLNDNDAGVAFSGPSYLVNENGGTVTLTVNRVGPVTAGAVLNWATTNSTATSGTDFGIAGNAAPRSGGIFWSAGDGTAKTVSIAILNNATAQGSRAFTVTLTPTAPTVLGSPGTATVTIFDDESAAPSTLQLAQAKYLVREGPGASVVLAVTRNGDPALPVTVSYTTAAATALATTDFTTTNGTLAWAAGDSTPKTIVVPITNDAVAESPEHFTVTLSAPSPGSGLGANASAAVLIEDDDEVFPPAGLIPLGWVTPSGATTGWHVSNDTGPFEGVYALRADKIYENESAGIEVSGTYQAGTVAFRYRVQSELDLDFLRFFVDGVEVAKFSGTAVSGWTAFSHAVPAGTHTFRWVYTKDGSISAGGDTAWIDAVTLPVQ